MTPGARSADVHTERRKKGKRKRKKEATFESELENPIDTDE